MGNYDRGEFLGLECASEVDLVDFSAAEICRGGVADEEDGFHWG